MMSAARPAPFGSRRTTLRFWCSWRRGGSAQVPQVPWAFVFSWRTTETKPRPRPDQQVLRFGTPLPLMTTSSFLGCKTPISFC